MTIAAVRRATVLSPASFKQTTSRVLRKCKKLAIYCHYLGNQARIRR
jgi:hypothetical protein